MAETTLKSDKKKDTVRSVDEMDKQLKRIRANNDDLTALADELEQIAASRNTIK